MSRYVPADQLPETLTAQEAVEAAYPTELDRCERALSRGLPVLVRCDKELTHAFYRAMRTRLRARELRCDYLDGRPRPGDIDPVSATTSMVAAILRQLREAVRGPAGGRVVIMPHLDVLSAGMGGSAHEVREVIPLLYENPDIVWLGFEDPSYALPSAIERLFPHREAIYGVRRDRLAHLVTQREAGALGGDLDTHALYACVSGMSVIRLRRVLSALADDGPNDDPRAIYDRLRELTLSAELTIPHVDLEADIGGYPRAKDRLTREVIDIVRRKDELDDEADIAQVEAILPRGFVIWGPAGTGKTLFAEAVATSIGAAVLPVNGPELKTRWLLERTDHLRQIFVQARRSAPSLVVIDGLDAFARPAAQSDATSQAMVKQLLAEMDQLRDSELVFVVGITRHVGTLEPTLMRPGRFEFHVQVPYPDVDNRRAILRIHDDKLGLQMTEDALEHAVRSTSGIVDGTTDERYSGDHLQALCRQLARQRLRDRRSDATTASDVDVALETYLERPELSPEEQLVIATHEAGHAICALTCSHAPPIDRISVRGDLGALGYVRYQASARHYVIKQAEVLDIICTLFGGREAERLVFDDVSAGAGNDLLRATDLARVLVEELAMGSEPLQSRVFTTTRAQHPLSPEALAALERDVHRILDEQRQRCRDLLIEHRDALNTLRDALLDRQVLDAAAVAALLPELVDGPD